MEEICNQAKAFYRCNKVLSAFSRNERSLIKTPDTLKPFRRQYDWKNSTKNFHHNFHIFVTYI